ncbi:MAG: hypothetical protein GX862_09355 [Leucobacter sp.]|nr:hypothetical protein [Leucobacter sp.]
MNALSRIFTATAATALAAGALLVPATAQAAPVLTEGESTTAANICVVTGGDLEWGVRESFRSYISGLAGGSWDVADGATYETPLFGWHNATGEIDANTGEGLISFTGMIHFDGHEGVLNMNLSNPTLELKSDGTARLLVDTKSNDPDGNLKLDEQQATFAKIEGIDAFDPATGQHGFTDASAVLTSEGATAFGGFYASGEDLDPITLSVQFSACEGNGAATDAENQADEGNEVVVDAPATSEQAVPWAPIALSGVAIVVIAVAAGMLIAGRKKPGAN